MGQNMDSEEDQVPLLLPVFGPVSLMLNLSTVGLLLIDLYSLVFHLLHLYLVVEYKLYFNFMSVMTDCILPVSLVFHQEAMDMLVFNAQKLNNAVKETVRAAEAASIRVRLYFFSFFLFKKK